jgi:hypothetical protein
VAEVRPAALQGHEPAGAGAAVLRDHHADRLGHAGFGKDFLRLRIDRSAKSYWIEREPPGPPPQSMKNQF